MTINLKQVIDAVESANEVCTDLYDGISLSAAASLIFFPLPHGHGSLRPGFFCSTRCNVFQGTGISASKIP